jgi:hypothetical protein
MEARLPAHLEVSGLMRAVQAAGGFAALQARGERETGTILVICCDRGATNELYERMPTARGDRQWALVRKQTSDNHSEFDEYLSRRRKQDPDLWIVELDIPQAQRFIGIDDTAS